MPAQRTSALKIVMVSIGTAVSIPAWLCLIACAQGSHDFWWSWPFSRPRHRSERRGGHTRSIRQAWTHWGQPNFPIIPKTIHLENC